MKPVRVIHFDYDPSIYRYCCYLSKKNLEEKKGNSQDSNHKKNCPIFLSTECKIPFLGDGGDGSVDCCAFVMFPFDLFSSFFRNLTYCFRVLSSEKLGGDGGGDGPKIVQYVKHE